jgi:hypothetical protein
VDEVVIGLGLRRNFAGISVRQQGTLYASTRIICNVYAIIRINNVQTK